MTEMIRYDNLKKSLNTVDKIIDSMIRNRALQVALL